MRRPLRILGVIANPTDLPRFDDARVWQEIQDALARLPAPGAFAWERLVQATEEGLKTCLSHDDFQVLHFVVHAQERRLAKYATIALESSERRARNVTAPYLANLISASPSVKWAVLQACEERSFCFDIISEALARRGVNVIAAPPVAGRALTIFVSKVYTGVETGLDASALEQDVIAAGTAVRVVNAAVRVEPAAMSATGATFASEASIAASETAQPRPPAPDWSEALDRKRAAGEFDVFLCYNWADRPAVKRLAQRLKECGILPWLDAWELPPGQPWQPLLERQITTIKSAAVFVGSAGMGPWQEQEMYGFLREFVGRRAPVIPVLLPDVPTVPVLPVFLRAMTWVDFRCEDPDPFQMLLWGITGQRPED
jgi:hypothetical protein